MNTLRLVLHGIATIIIVAIGTALLETQLEVHPSLTNLFIIVAAIVAILVWSACYFLIENTVQPRPRNSVVKERLWPLWPI